MTAAETAYTSAGSQAWNRYLERLDELNSQLEHTRQILEGAFITAWNNALRDWTEMESEARRSYQSARAQMLQQPPEGPRQAGPAPVEIPNLLATRVTARNAGDRLQAAPQQQVRNTLTLTIRSRELQPGQKFVTKREKLLWQFGITARSSYDKQKREIIIEDYGPAGFLGPMLEQKDLLGILNISLQQIANLAVGAKLSASATFSRRFVLALKNWRIKDGKNALNDNGIKVATVSVEFEVVEILKQNVKIAFDVIKLADGFTISYGKDTRVLYSGRIELRLSELLGNVGYSVWIGGKQVLDIPGIDGHLTGPEVVVGEQHLSFPENADHYLTYLAQVNKQ
uniref:Uncharacterized protein n=1 Tax=uncultured Planctomycetota bacterium TaxID=120965 RepID=H5SE80_9BACT|nr:hypothetical protein HGMM_F16E03C05 [uncultured Planctomycetota bacterium]